jgi:hypothetical protein
MIGVSRPATLCRLAAVLALCASAACTVATQETPAPDPRALAETWTREHRRLPAPPLVTHALVEAEVARLVRESEGLVRSEVAGQSVEGRAIHHLTVGRGALPVLLWSQMHGDEPTATSALFDLCQWLLARRTEPVPARILDQLTLHVVPMLNPDGAELFTRRNAQGLDINRDARLLQSPEGRVLKAIRDAHQPRIGFNLHNQNWRTSVGRPPKPAVISLLAVAYDEARSDNDIRRLTKRTSSVIAEALAPLVAGHIGRYDDEYEPRAFGDSITRWGTGVVLIETGPWPGSAPDTTLVQLNFVALVSALDALASGRVHQADPGVYEALPQNEGRLLHTVVRNATIVPGTGVAPFTGDVGIAGTRIVRTRNGVRDLRWQASIADMGDLQGYGALVEVDGTGLVLAPAYDPAVKAGQTVTLPARPGTGAPRIAVGQPGSLWLLRAREDGRHELVQHVQAE